MQALLLDANAWVFHYGLQVMPILCQSGCDLDVAIECKLDGIAYQVEQHLFVALLVWEDLTWDVVIVKVQDHFQTFRVGLEL